MSENLAQSITGMTYIQNSSTLDSFEFISLDISLVRSSKEIMFKKVEHGWGFFVCFSNMWIY